MPALSANIDLEGPGASTVAVLPGAGIRFQIFNVAAGATATIAGLTITDGDAVQGGGILNNGTLTVRSCSIVYNEGYWGGGVYNDGTLTLVGSTVAHNSATLAGGGVLNHGQMTVADSTIADNSSGVIGGVANSGTMTLVGSTVARNTANGYWQPQYHEPPLYYPPDAGGINNSGTLTLLNSTVAANQAGNAGAGGVKNAGTLTVADSTISGNGGVGIATDPAGSQPVTVTNTIVAGNAASDISGAVTTVVCDLIGNGDGSSGVSNGVNGSQVGTAAQPLDPRLGPLQDNGGPTQTMALLPGSPAIDAGSDAIAQALGLSTDQRGPGFPRILGPAVDLGAFEAQSPFANLTPADRFVQALYLDELGRAGSTAELDSWAVAFNDGSSQMDAQAAIATGIEQSFEGRDHLVKGWYQTFLGRAAVGGEELGWVGLLFQGQTEEQVLSQILASPEFYGRAQTLSASGTADQRFVQALYPLLLGRTASDAEVMSWVATLPQQGRLGVALGFLTSGEYRTDLVQSDYGVLLHRSPDPQGLAFWVGVGEDALDLRIGFEASPEFFTNG